MMRRVSAIAGSALFLVIAPGFVAGRVPWWISRWRIETPFFGMPLFRGAGGVLITLGAIGLLDSFLRFALKGVGYARAGVPDAPSGGGLVLMPLIYFFGKEVGHPIYPGTVPVSR